MQINHRFGPIELGLTLRRVQPVIGVNSLIAGTDKHVLMWDFDNPDKTDVIAALLVVMQRWHLPDCELLQTGKGWHAYCFTACDWPDALSIVHHTKCVDLTYVKLAAVRGYFTLRITGKGGQLPGRQPVTVKGSYRPTVDPAQLRNLQRYWTPA